MPASPPTTDPVLADLDLADTVLPELEPGVRSAEPLARLRVPIGPGELRDAALALRARDAVDACLTERGLVLLSSRCGATERELCALRNRLWPVLHVQRVYLLEPGVAITRVDATGRTRLLERADHAGFVLACRRRAAAMAPDVTKEKFDAKAAGWNGEPGSPQYGHFRWMRRLLAQLARPRSGESAIDAGSGAGWVGIEAALLGAQVAAFDPSEQMVRLVEANARDQHVTVRARVGFCEDPPFAETFDLVLNSGVISFSPDPERFLDGIDRLVRPGGRLVIGDLNPRSRGFSRRRERRLIVPVRELNGLTREDVAQRLQRRGYDIQFRRYYQLTWPIPELGHRTRSHLVGKLLLLGNRLASAVDAALGARAATRFDSWIIGARKKS